MLNHKYKRIIEENKPIKTNYIKTVYFQENSDKQELPFSKWFQLWLLEIFFGEEILESLIMTSGNSGEKDSARIYGQPLPLRHHIPSGIVSNIFQDQLVDLLYYKFCEQYKLLDYDQKEANFDEKGGVLDLTRVKFFFRKSYLPQIIAFRRVYLLNAFIMNGIIDLITQCIWHNWLWTIIVGCLVESIRRLCKL